MKKLLFTSALLLQITLGFSQDYKFIDKNLHTMSQEEMIDHQVTFSADTPMYDIKGNTIDPSQINDLMVSGNFFPIIYGDKNFKAQAIVFRKATKKEKEQMQNAMQANDPNANFVAGQMAKDFTAYDINENKITLKNLKGKIVVMNFWFPECKPCIEEMPALNKLVEKYNKKEVVFLSVTFDKKEKIKKFLSNRSFDYTHITDNEPILSDYKVSAFPTHILIDKNGEIIMRKVGNFVKELDIKIDLLLNK